MAAFTGYDPIDSEREKRRGRYGNFDPSNLQRLDPRNAPAGPPAASRGALPAPAAPAAGAPSTAFNLPTPGDEGKGVGEARKPAGKDFFSIWDKGSSEDRDAIADSMADNFGQQGMSLEGATKMMFDQGGEVAAQIGRKFGLVPDPERAGMPAFKTTEQAVADMESERSQRKAKNDKRRAMGGFLMEMGLNILASNREDAGGAIAEGALGTIGARRGREAQEEQRKIDREERKRRRAREDAQERRAEAAETRADRRLTMEEEKAGKPKLAQITDKDGNVLYVEEKAGYVTDAEGKRVRRASDAELSAAQRETSERARQNQIQQERRAIQKIVDEGFSDDPEIMAIIDMDDPKARRQAIAKLAKDRVGSIGGAASNDPLGLGL